MKHSIDRANRGTARCLLALLCVTATATACIEDDSPVIVEPADPPALFERYVSLGNSITAGYQSGGLHEELQREAYPVLLAEKAGARFPIPAVAYPGCPVPLASPFPPTLISDEAPDQCRVLPVREEARNLAVPGAAVADLANPLWHGGGLAAVLLGGRTQLGLLLERDPTLISVWIGNNDALGAALSGNPASLTPVDAFEAAYEEIVQAILATDAGDAILIGVVNPVLVPALQPGAFFWGADQPGSPFAEVLEVDPGCAPGTDGGTRLVSFVTVTNQLAEDPAEPVVIGCAADDPFVLTDDEVQAVGTRVAMFNAYIQEQAEENGWIYVDPAALIGPALADPDLIRKCQGLADATTPEEFQAAIETTCPGPQAPNFFGSYFSLDGIHPSGRAHTVIADALAGLLNQKHDLDLPTGL